MENNATPSSIPDPDLSPENSPVGPGRAQVGTRRINNTPMVIVFVLMVLFLFVVIAVMYSRSKRQIAQNTEQHTSASKQADSIIPKQLAWTQAPVTPTPPPNLAPMIQAVVPPPPPTEPPVDPVNNARLQALQTALSAKPNVEGVTLAKTTAATATGSAGENDPEARKLSLLRGILARDQENKGAGDAGSTASRRPISRASLRSMRSTRTAGRAAPRSKTPRASCYAPAASSRVCSSLASIRAARHDHRPGFAKRVRHADWSVFAPAPR